MEAPRTKKRRGSPIAGEEEPEAVLVHAPVHGYDPPRLPEVHENVALAIRRPHVGLPSVPSSVEISERAFEEDYVIGDELGRGAFSIVRRCTHRATGQVRAVKIIDTRRFRLSHTFRATSVLDEVRILRGLSHPGVIRVYEVYDHTGSPPTGGAGVGSSLPAECILVVTELASGGELFDSILSAGNFAEPQARHVAWVVLQALSYLHEKGVVHRDLKPENLLVGETVYVPADDAVVRPGVAYPHAPLVGQPSLPMLQVKLADFGVARYVGNAAYSAGASTFVGSPQYVAPEVLFARDHAAHLPVPGGVPGSSASTYGRAVDVYSLGVVVYVMLAGYLPFDDGAPAPTEPADVAALQAALMARRAAAEAQGASPAAAAELGLRWEDRVMGGLAFFAPPVWTHVSERGKDLLRRMMEPDPRLRFTVHQAKAHPWFAPQRAAEEAGRRPPVAWGGSAVMAAPAAWGSVTGGSGGQVTGERFAMVVAPLTIPPAPSDDAGMDGEEGSSRGAEFHIDATQSGGKHSATAISPRGSDHEREPFSFASALGSTAEGGPSNAELSGRQVEIMHAVAHSINFSALLRMQIDVANTFYASYASVRAIPAAAAIVRSHAVASRELQRRVHRVVLTCRSLAVAILDIMPDLHESVTEHDGPGVRAIFERMASWVADLKREASSMQGAYAELTERVQSSLEQARILNLGLLGSHGHGPGVPTPPSGHRHSITPWLPHGITTVRPDALVLVGGGEWRREETPTATSGSRASSDARFDARFAAGRTSAQSRSESIAGTEEKIIDLLASPLRAGSGGEGAGAAPSLPTLLAALSVGDKSGERAPRPLLPIDFGQAPELGAARAPRPPTRVGSGGSLAGGSGGGSEGEGSPLPPPSSWGQHSHAGGGPQGSPSYPYVAPTTPASSSSPLSDHLPSMHTALATLPPDGTCLGCALEGLRAVDSLLGSAVDFWTSMEVVIDVLVRRKEHSATLLESTSARLVAKALASLTDYAFFWRAFAVLAGRYGEAVHGAAGPDYSWLVAGDEEWDVGAARRALPQGDDSAMAVSSA